MDNINYTGITIGPIYETMNLANKYYSLWLSSYMFSYFSKSLQDKLGKDRVVFPCFEDKEENRKCFESGVGLFDDRIICKGKIEKEEILKLKREVCENMAEYFCSAYDNYSRENMTEVLFQYIHTGIVYKNVNENENTILAFDSELAIADNNFKVVDNSLEKDVESFKKIFLSSGDYAKKVRSAFNCNQGNNIDAIFNSVNDKEQKTSKYYACISSDGDFFSKYLVNVTGANKDLELKEFSKKCFEYGVDVAKMIQDYGGMSIYQGGDDVLCLLPIKNKGKNVFEFIKNLNNIFKEKFVDCRFDDGKKTVTVSTAICMRYYKYPVAEAMEEAKELLGKIKSKEINNGEKNMLLINLQKHSGQTYEMKFSNNSEYLNRLINMFSLIEEELNKKENCEIDVHSIKTNIYKFRNLLEIALANNNREYIDNLFENIYDRDLNTISKKLINIVKDYLYDYSIEYIDDAIGIVGITSFMEEVRGVRE